MAGSERLSIGIAAALVVAVVVVAFRRAHPPAVVPPAAASSAVAPAAPGDGVRAEEAVRGTFEAIAKNDCAAFAPSITGELAERMKTRSCKELLESYEEHKFRLIRTDGSEPDARSPSTARMVKIRVNFEKGERVGLARVEKVGDVWKVAAF